MGVHGLWNLLEPSGKPVPLETLENKVLAVDVSIWLHQLVKGFQDSRGNPLPNAHLLGLFHRICKLLFFKIKPVFVFDGDVPLLKKQTVAARQRQRGKLQDDATEMRQKLAKNILKHAAVKAALGSEKTDQQVSLNIPRQRQEPDIFELPPLQPSEQRDSSGVGYMSSSDDDDSDSEEANAHMHADLHSIDVNSEDFKALPADIRHDILTELKETRKQNSWGRLHEMPEDSGQFSNFQMSRLIKRRNFQVSLEEAEKEMGGRTLTLGELEEVLNENGVITDASFDPGRRIASDSTTRFVYIREAAKKTLFSPASTKTTIKEPHGKDLPQSSNASISQPGSSKDLIEQTRIEKIIPAEDDQFEDDWISDSECGVEVDSGKFVKDKHSRVDLARDFMFVASDLTQDQIGKILSKRNSSPQKKGKPQPGPSSVVEEFSNPGTSTYFTNVSPPKQELDYIGIISDESDSDIEEIEKKEATDPKPIEIIVQPDKEYNIEEDIFADMFFNIEHAMLQHKKQEVESTKNLHKSQDGKVSSCIKDWKNSISSVDGNSKLGSKIESSFAINSDEADDKKIVGTEVKNDEVKARVFSSENDNEPEVVLTKASDNLSVTATIEQKSSDDTCDKKVPVESKSSPISSKAATLLTHKFQEENIDLKDGKRENSVEKVSVEDKEPENLLLTAANSRLEVIESMEIAATKLSPPRNVTSPVTEGKHEETSKSNTQSDDESFDDFHAEDSIAEELTDDEKEDNENSVLDVPQPIASTSKISTVELQGMQASLENQHQSLLNEKGKADRMAASITSQMSTEAQELLRLFGLPYLVAPMEAEAQCAFLDAVSLTDGTISDDSDIWLFGGRKVYKNFFNQKKHVMQFTSGDIQHVLKLPRNQMILLALLTGSDYTSGLSGVGPVTALEILAAFPSGRIEDERHLAQDLLAGLKKFREWFMNGRPAGPRTAKLRNKLKDIELTDGFPSLAVIEGYLKPTIDESKEKFTWGKPDLVRLQEYARIKFGWTKMKTDEILIPVINKLNERHKQMSLDGYLSVRLPPADGKLSKRVQQAVHRLAAEPTTSDTEDDPQPVTKRKKGSLKRTTDSNQPSENKKSKGKNAKDVTKATKDLVSVTSNEYIPQREKDRLNALQSKIKAIELFRTSKLEGKKSAKYKRPIRLEKTEADLSESDSD